MNAKTDKLLDEIASKVKKLKARNDRLEKENESLQKSVFEYLKKLEQYKLDIEKTKKESISLQISTQLKDNNRKMHKEIDKYIAIINKCIASIENEK